MRHYDPDYSIQMIHFELKQEELDIWKVSNQQKQKITELMAMPKKAKQV